ncbi:MAG: prepilin peptidase [Campylobacterota bacterium]|nr:prepilin peptidase [Campylobacterota bacterium]
MFGFTFYLFSFLLSYFDRKRFIVPNVILSTCFLLLMFFGYFEQQLNIYSFVVSILVLLFFIILMLLKPTMILGGGDIKYMMLVAIYLNPILFPMFLLVTGLVQTIFLVYKQYYKRRRVAPMVPAMFIAVIIVELLFSLGVYP